MKIKALVIGLSMVAAQVASAETILCTQGAWNLVMQMEYGQLRSAQLESGEYTGSVDPNDISYSGGSDAFIRTDVEYNATGAFSNCHAQ